MSFFALILILIAVALYLGFRGRLERPEAPIAGWAVLAPTGLLMVLLAYLLVVAVQVHRFDGLRVVLEGVSVDIPSLKSRPITLGGDHDQDTLIAEGLPPQVVRLGLNAAGAPVLTVAAPPPGAPDGQVTVDGHPAVGSIVLNTAGRATKLRFFRAEPREGETHPRLVEKRSLDLIVHDGRIGLLLDSPGVQRISGEQLQRALELRRQAGFDTVVLSFAGPSSGSAGRAPSGLPFAALGDRARGELSGRIELSQARGGFNVFDGRGGAAMPYGRAFTVGGDLAALARIDRIDLGWSAYRDLTWLPFAALALSLLGTWVLRRQSGAAFLILSVLDLLLLMRLIVAVEAAYVSDAMRVTLAVHDSLIALLAAPFLVASLAPSSLDRRPRLWHGVTVVAAVAALAASRALAGGEHAFGRAPGFAETLGVTGAMSLGLGLIALARLLPWGDSATVGSQVAAAVGPFAAKLSARLGAFLAKAPARIRTFALDRDDPWLPIVALGVLGLVRITLLAVGLKEALRLPGLRLPISAVYTPLTLALFAWALIRMARRAPIEGERWSALVSPLLWLAWIVALVAAPIAVRDSGYLLTNAGPFLLWGVFAALTSDELTSGRRIGLGAPAVLTIFVYLVLSLHAQLAAPRPDLIAQAAQAPTSAASHRVLSAFAEEAGNKLRLEAVFDPQSLSYRGSAAAERDRDVIAHRTVYAGSWTGRGWLSLDRPTLLEKTQLDDDVSEIHLLSPFGRTGGAAFLAVEGLIAALATFATLRRRNGDVLKLSVGASVALLGLWTLFSVSAYMILGVSNLVPFTGRDVYLLAAASPSDLFESLLLVGLAFLFLVREEIRWRA